MFTHTLLLLRPRRHAGRLPLPRAVTPRRRRYVQSRFLEYTRDQEARSRRTRTGSRFSAVRQDAPVLYGMILEVHDRVMSFDDSGDFGKRLESDLKNRNNSIMVIKSWIKFLELIDIYLKSQEIEQHRLYVPPCIPGDTSMCQVAVASFDRMRERVCSRCVKLNSNRMCGGIGDNVHRLVFDIGYN